MKDATMPDIIALVDHPANTDPTATYVAQRRGPAIYQTRGGYVVCVSMGKALDGWFGTMEEAVAAQNKALER